jgi:hypothetical protein
MILFFSFLGHYAILTIMLLSLETLHYPIKPTNDNQWASNKSSCYLRSPGSPLTPTLNPLVWVISDWNELGWYEVC